MPIANFIDQLMCNRILLVDDEQAVLFVYRRLLESDSMTVDTAESSEEAESLLNSRNYQAVVLDVRLSGSEKNEGLQILEKVKKATPETAVIVISAYGNSDIRNRCSRLGVTGYFEKPVSVGQIKQTLASIGIS
jgi:DNA-binding NtrC family response regulator